MNIRPYWQYYKDIFPFIAGFGMICCIATSVLWGFGLFCTLGVLFGFFGFQVFKNDQYYFYYNLGITKWKLLKVSFIINLLVGVPIFSFLLISFYFFFGSFTIT